MGAKESTCMLNADAQYFKGNHEVDMGAKRTYYCSYVDAIHKEGWFRLPYIIGASSGTYGVLLWFFFCMYPGMNYLSIVLCVDNSTKLARYSFANNTLNDGVFCVSIWRRRRKVGTVFRSGFHPTNGLYLRRSVAFGPSRRFIA